MTYGTLAAGSCLLTDIVDQLHETSRKVNSVERLTRHLNKGTPVKALSTYLFVIRKWILDEPAIHIDDVTFSAMERGAAMFGRATFVMDRGYDDNKMFLKLDELEQDYVIRLTARRKLYFHGKWIPAMQLRN